MEFKEKIKAMKERDKKYDGRFYVAVKTTGIVCKPSCPAKPLEKNVVFMIRLKKRWRRGFDLAKYV